MLVIHNALIYTLNACFDTVQAMCIQDGRIVAVGNNDAILQQYPTSNCIDMAGKAIYPGFFDAHCHFIAYALSLYEADLRNCTSFADMIARVVQYRQANPDATYIIGRGWNENEWQQSEQQNTLLLDNRVLNEAISDIPVLLTRIDLHAALVNDAALQLANYSTETSIDGGILQQKKGKLSGLLIDNAMYPLFEKLPKPDPALLEKAILKAQENCFAVGLTTISDALSLCNDVLMFDKMQQSGLLKLRIYAMIDGASPRDKNYFLQNGHLRTERLHVRCIKYFSDGALGSRGAWLLNPYSDSAQQYGLARYESDVFLAELQQCYAAGFQVATHAIGDAANRFVLQHYAKVLNGNNSYRWRLEHAQVLQPTDTDLIGQHHIIPSIQATHATSDMSWVATRLGNRVEYAYRWQDLWQQNGMVAAGSDFPIENINPLLGFYAAVARRDVQGNPTEGFMPQQALTRQQALQAMTIYAAYANAEETEKGSLEVGKYADFVVLDRNIMTVPIEELPTAKVLQTWINGEKVY